MPNKIKLALLLFMVPFICFAEQNKKADIGILYDEQNPAFEKDRKKIDKSIKEIEGTGLKTEKFKTVLFNEDMKQELSRYKRIYIPDSYPLFTREAYQGMAEYVRNGGLLITSSPLVAVDANGNGAYDKEEMAKEKINKKNPEWPLHGVYAHSTAAIKTIKILFDCPLTRGFHAGTSFEEKGFMRCTKNKSAEMVVSADVVYKDKENLDNTPLLSYKKSGKGAFIYIAYEGNKKLFLNCFSNEVLDWLVYDAR